MRVIDGYLDGAGGLRIFWQSWLPEDEARAVIVIVHGLGEHVGRYAHVAEALVGDGYAVYAGDHRGHGRSDGPREVIDRLGNAVADVDQLVLQAREQHPTTPVYLLGHSMGGTVSLAYIQRHQDRLAGLLLSGPLAALDAAPAPLRIIGRVLSTLAPRLPMLALDANLVSRDPKVVSAYVSDPLVHHGKIPARTLHELAVAIDAFPDTVTAITVPTLILYGTADGLCPPAGSQMLAKRIGAEDITIKAYQGLYHEILNEPERDEVLADIKTWLAQRLPADAGDGVPSPAGSSNS